eukprot:SAG31_NODE_31412_length_368_cov_1.156134_1_plen_26_part_10
MKQNKTKQNKIEIRTAEGKPSVSFES